MTKIVSYLSSADVTSLLIALIGAIISILAALYLTARKINAEFRIRRIDLTNHYSESLLSKRLELYPALFSFLNSYEKMLLNEIPNGDAEYKLPLRNIYDFEKNIIIWDTHNGLILSGNSAIAYARLREELRIIRTNNDFDKYASFPNDIKYKKIRDAAEQLEIALRIDIGIYEVDEFEARKVVKSYQEHLERIGHKS